MIDDGQSMIEWLRKESGEPTIDLAGRAVPIELNRHPRAKRLTLRLAPDGSSVRITLPRWCPTGDALRFAAIRRHWLEAQLDRIPATEDPVARGTLRFRGEMVEIVWEQSAPRRAKMIDGKLHVGGPRDTLAKRLQRWLEAEALQMMELDLAHACRVAGIAVPQVRLTRAKRRWGSCSSGGTVRVNWRLVQAPDHVRRSVVAHETAHLVHFDHSADFHALLEKI
ncbi:MAG: M48 family metallopeptidase, partial [Qipengyuania sp.]